MHQSIPAKFLSSEYLTFIRSFAYIARWSRNSRRNEMTKENERLHTEKQFRGCRGARMCVIVSPERTRVTEDARDN